MSIEGLKRVSVGLLAKPILHLWRGDKKWKGKIQVGSKSGRMNMSQDRNGQTVLGTQLPEDPTLAIRSEETTFSSLLPRLGNRMLFEIVRALPKKTLTSVCWFVALTEADPQHIYLSVEFLHSSLNFGKTGVRQVVQFVSDAELAARHPEASVFLIQW